MTDWAVPQASRLKYGQFFNIQDRQRSGFLTGAQASNILLQSGLQQQVLAQVWSLADADKDGMLTSEEFTLAMHLIDCVKEGRPLPSQLPPELMPPTLRRKLSLVSPTLSDKGRTTPQTASVPVTGMLPRHGSVSSVGSGVSSVGMGMPTVPVAAGSPVAQIDTWAVPHASKLRYTQVFNTADKDRTGFLTGLQARGILLQSGLAQQTLAGVWVLSDIDKDGRLNCEEFVLAMHLIDLVRSGDPLPAILPPELIPPTFRKRMSLNGVTPVSSVPPPVPPPPASITPTPDALNKHSFEDKRKENFEKGQAELEKRRQQLLEQQRREQEERDRKEREEAEKRERARLEAERKRQEELERQLQRQREIEAAKEEERRKQLEQREAARREMERQRLIEWEAQKKSEMHFTKQRVQEQLVSLKARKAAMMAQVEQVDSTLAKMKSNVEATRKKVAESKSGIDQMRIDRDSKLREMSLLRSAQKQLQERQLLIEQQRLTLTAELKSFQLTQAAGNAGDTTEFALQAKQTRITQLKQQEAELEEQHKQRQADLDELKAQVQEQNEKLEKILEAVEIVRQEYEQKRAEAMQVTADAQQAAEQAAQAAVNADFNAGWDSAPTNAPVTTFAELSSSSGMSASTSGVKYRAIYEFEARNQDELPLQVGDIVILVSSESDDSGWLQGECNGVVGWFPESYVERLDDSSGQADAMYANESSSTKANETSSGVLGLVTYDWQGKEDNQLTLVNGDHVKVTDQSQDEWWFGEVGNRSGWFPSSCVRLDGEEAQNNSVNLNTNEAIYYIAAYPFETQEVGDLAFDVNELIKVNKKEGAWWTGEIGDRNGIFPSNYVREATPKEIEELQFKNETTVSTSETKPESVASKLSVSEQGSIRCQDSPKLKTKSKTKKPEIVRVIADYKATGDAQIDLEKGQLIQVRKKADTGWWEGEVQVKGKKRQVGWFPASYVKPLAVPTSDTGSARSTPDLGVKESDAKKVRAIYRYKARQSDELSFETGEIIVILSEEDQVWWKGQSQTTGQSGLFPSTYVEPYERSISYEANSSDDEDLDLYLEDDNSSFYSDSDESESNSPTCSPQEVYNKQLEAEFREKLLHKFHAFQQRYIEEKSNFKNTSSTASLSFASHDKSTNVSIFDPLSNEPEQLGNYQIRVDKCIQEFISSEQTYVCNLERMQHFFLRPVKASFLLTEEKLQAIFLNIEELIKIGQKFVKNLENAGDNVLDVIADHLSNSTTLNVYTNFCMHQLKASETLQQQLSENQSFSRLVRHCEMQLAREQSFSRISNNLHIPALPLGGYLLQPMQRITRYPLLLQNALKHTQETDGEHDKIKTVLKIAEQLVQTVNERFKEEENHERLKWMQKHISYAFMLQYRLNFDQNTRVLGPRILLKAGTLIKANSRRKLVAFLCNDMLILTTCTERIYTTNLFACDRALRASYRLYRPPYSLNEIFVLSNYNENEAIEHNHHSSSPSTNFKNTSRSELSIQTDGRVFMLGMRSGRRSLILRSINERETSEWINLIEKWSAKCMNNERMSLTEQPLLQQLDVGLGMVGELYITIYELRRLFATNYSLNAYCIISVGEGDDISKHDQRTHTSYVRAICTDDTKHTQIMSHSFSENKSKRGSWTNMLTHRKNSFTSLNRSSPGNLNDNNVATFTARFNFMCMFLLPLQHDHWHLGITCYEKCAFSPDVRLGHMIVPINDLLCSAPCPSRNLDSSITKRTMRIQLVDAVLSQILQPEIDLKANVKNLSSI